MLLRVSVGSYGILNIRIATLWSWKAEHRMEGWAWGGVGTEDTALRFAMGSLGALRIPPPCLGGYK